MDVLDNIQMLNKEDDVSEELNKFLGVLRSFNNNQALNREFTDKLIQFFSLKVKYDKNNFLDNAEDMEIFNKIPVDL